MKKRLAVAIVLSLVMLVTLATPALAGRPTRTSEFQFENDPIESEKITLQATHDNHLKIKVVINGATPGYVYSVTATGDPFPSGGAYLEVNDRGVGKFTGISEHPYTSATTSIRVYLNRASATKFYTVYLPITFKD